MAIQLGNFQPQIPQHYQLAETQSEKDADASRDIAKIKAQGANHLASEYMQQQGASARQGAELAVKQEQLGQANAAQLRAEDRQAQQDQFAEDQRAIENDRADRALDQDMVKLGQAQKNTDRAFKLQEEHSNREREKFLMDLHDYRSMHPFKAQTLAYAQIGQILDNVEVDPKTGVADVTPYKKQIANIYGISPGGIDTMSVWGNKENGSMEFYVYDTNKKTSRPLLNKEGAPLPFSYKDLQAAKEFVNSGFKPPKEDKPMVVPEYDEDGNKIGAKLYDPQTKSFINPSAAPDPAADAMIKTFAGSAKPKGIPTPQLGKPAPQVVAPQATPAPQLGGIGGRQAQHSDLYNRLEKEQDPEIILNLLGDKVEPFQWEDLQKLQGNPQAFADRVRRIRDGALNRGLIQ